MKSDRTAMEAIFGRELLPLARRWRAEADHTLSDLGLSHASGWALLQVGRLGDAVRQSDLAAELDMQGPSLVRLIDRLEADSLIMRRLDEADRRVNRIHLTEAGAALVGRIEQALRRIRHEMLDGIDDDALNAATRVLLRISQRIAERRGQAR
jgi:MarR family transcriptional regulator, transcriptional regulator for hemolysin